jgi:pimeloyl-ACP methyl ester carboxylesterase
MATHYNTVTVDTGTVDGVDVFYREDGPTDAPVVLLLPGFPSSSRMYRDLIPRLAGQYHVIAPDYPAFGHSGVPARDEFSYTFDGLARITGHLLAHLGIERFALYAMDFGAPVGFRLVLENPDRLTALILQNAPLYPEAPEGWWATLGAYWREDTPARREAARSYLTPAAIEDQYRYGVADPALLDPDSWLVDSALIARPGVDEIMLDLLHDIKNNAAVFAGMQQYLSQRQPPVLVATGANDEIFPEPVVRRVLDAVPGAEYHALPTGHFALEDHAPQIAGLILDFLPRALK